MKNSLEPNKSFRTPLHFNRIKAEPAYRLVSNEIAQRIIRGDIKTGDVIPSEANLAAQLGVNRSTVREGIRLLEENGLVRREGGKRLFASVPQSKFLAAQMTRALILHEATFEEIWETMMALEPSIAEHAAQRATADDIEAIEENLARTRRSLTNRENLVELDVEFHSLVSRAAHNRALVLAREPLGLLFYPAFYSVMTHLNASERLLVAHETIAKALREHDAEQARSWMQKHIVDFRRGYALANRDIKQPIVALGSE